MIISFVFTNVSVKYSDGFVRADTPQFNARANGLREIKGTKEISFMLRNFKNAQRWDCFNAHTTQKEKKVSELQGNCSQCSEKLQQWLAC